MRKRLVSLTLVVLALLAAAGSGAYLWLSRSGRPQRSGEAALAGLRQSVEVRWDEWAVPHVRAASVEDAAAAMGWVHANDRFTQMEFGRRMASGTLAEVAGPAALPLDRYFRSLGFPQLQEAAAASLSSETHGLLQAYADGVNAWLATRMDDLPPELRLLGIEPRPWELRDSMAFLLHMQHELSFWNARPEEARFRALRVLGRQRLAGILGVDDLPVHPEIETMAALPPGVASGPSGAMPSPGLAGNPGSNNWALSGAWTAAGTALVANDPHLPLRLPGIWYQAAVRAPGYEAAGMTLPGFPFVVLGQSARLAWAMTNVMLDDHDLFFEQLDETGTQVRRGDTWLPLRAETGLIPLPEGGSEEIVVRFTDIGVLLEPDAARGLPARSMAWTAATGGDPGALFLKMARAETVDELIGSLEMHVAPAQNLVAADRDGGLLYTAIGQAPNRQGDGRLPLPGWLTETHWQGLRAQADNPTLLRPSDGLIVTANHDIRSLDPGGPDPTFRADFDTSHRAARIRELLQARRDWTPGTLAAVQTDIRSAYARELVPLLIQAAGAAAPAEVVSALSSWDGSMNAQGPAALFALVERESMRAVFGDEEAAAGTPGLADRDALLRALRSEMSDDWFDDIATDTVETPAATVAGAMARAWQQGAEAWGASVESWDWGQLHPLKLRNPLGAAPLVGAWLDRGPLGMVGSATTVAAFGGRWLDDSAPVAYGPSMRWISDVANPDGSMVVLIAGQAGHPWDPHYDDQLDAYLAGRLRPVRFSEKSIAAATRDTLVLRPSGE